MRQGKGNLKQCHIEAIQVIHVQSYNSVLGCHWIGKIWHVNLHIHWLVLLVGALWFTLLNRQQVLVNIQLVFIWHRYLTRILLSTATFGFGALKMCVFDHLLDCAQWPVLLTEYISRPYQTHDSCCKAWPHWEDTEEEEVEEEKEVKEEEMKKRRGRWLTGWFSWWRHQQIARHWLLLPAAPLQLWWCHRRRCSAMHKSLRVMISWPYIINSGIIDG